MIPPADSLILESLHDADGSCYDQSSCWWTHFSFLFYFYFFSKIGFESQIFVGEIWRWSEVFIQRLPEGEEPVVFVFGFGWDPYFFLWIDLIVPWICLLEMEVKGVGLGFGVKFWNLLHTVYHFHFHVSYTILVFLPQNSAS